MIKRSLLFLVVFASFSLTACGGGGGGNGGSGGALPTTPSGDVPISNGSSGTNTTSGVTIHEKGINDTLRGGLALGADGNLYASGQVGLQVFDQSLNIIPLATATTTTPPDTWPVVPHLSPSGAVSASSTLVGALATSTTGTKSAATATEATTTSTFPALAIFDTTTKQWLDVQFGNQGDVFTDLAPDGHAGFFIAGNHPNGQGFVEEINSVICFLVTQTFAQPLGPITLGHDGAPWVATAASKSVPSILFHLSFTGIAQTVPLPAGSEVTSMVVGPDGNLWFTDAGLNAIGRVDSSCNVTFFNVPSGKGLQLDGITVASDGTLWFTEIHGHRLGRITTSGVISEFMISPSADPHEAVGCDNANNTTCASHAVFYIETKAYGKATF